MAEELYVKLTEINELLPICCDKCREHLEDLSTVKVGARVEEVRDFLQRVHDDAQSLINWASQPIKNLSAKDRIPLFRKIQQAVEQDYKLPPDSLIKRTNCQEIAFPRQVAMLIARNLTFSSFPQIGQQFGAKHHTTVIHSIEKIKKQLLTDSELRKRIERIKKTLEGAY